MDYIGIYKEVDKEYKKYLKFPPANDTYKNTFVSFSGVPGSGKSTLAKEIVSIVGGIIVNKDDIRNIIMSLEPEISGEESHQIANKYLFNLMEELIESRIHLIIFDSSVDKKYEEYKKWCILHNFKFFIIQLEIKKEKALERLMYREQSDIAYYQERMENWEKDQVLFKKMGLADFVYSSHNNKEALFERLRSVLSSKI
jgi:predicted kinase